MAMAICNATNCRLFAGAWRHSVRSMLAALHCLTLCSLHHTCAPWVWEQIQFFFRWFFSRIAAYAWGKKFGPYQPLSRSVFLWTHRQSNSPSFGHHVLKSSHDVVAADKNGFQKESSMVQSVAHRCQHGCLWFEFGGLRNWRKVRIRQRKFIQLECWPIIFFSPP